MDKKLKVVVERYVDSVPKYFNRALRNMLCYYSTSEQGKDHNDEEHDTLIAGLEITFELLDAIEDERSMD